MTESDPEDEPKGCQIEGRGENRFPNLPNHWIRSDSKPFIETKLALLLFTVLCTLLSFSFFDLIDRSPLPTNKYEQQKYPGLNLDLSIAPGYTVADIHDIEIYYVFVLSCIVAILFVSFILVIGYPIIRYLDGVETGTNGLSVDRFAVSVVFGLLYVLSVIIILDFGPWMDYYPNPAFENNPEITYNTSAFGDKFYAPNGISQHFRKPFLTILFAQFFIIFMTTYLYLGRILPKGIKDKGSEYLQIYVNTWWKYTQIVLSVGVALAVGLIIPFSMDYTNYGRFGIIDVSILAFSGLGAFISFSITKIHYIRHKIIEEELLDSEKQVEIK